MFFVNSIFTDQPAQTGQNLSICMCAKQLFCVLEGECYRKIALCLRVERTLSEQLLPYSTDHVLWMFYFTLRAQTEARELLFQTHHFLVQMKNFFYKRVLYKG